MKRDYYDILGIARTATPELIRAAHRVQSRRYHPDTAEKGEGDASLFAEIQEAYETLSNPDTRRRYDTKEGFARGEYSAGSKRRPPKTPCGACGNPVYASQLTLYLGRHICQVCFDRKRQRDMNRPRLSSAAETLWKLKRLRVWAQSHLALIVVFLIAALAVGLRLSSMGGHPHRPQPTEPSTGLSNSADSAPTQTTTSNPCLVPPGPASEASPSASLRIAERP